MNKDPSYLVVFINNSLRSNSRCRIGFTFNIIKSRILKVSTGKLATDSKVNDKKIPGEGRDHANGRRYMEMGGNMLQSPLHINCTLHSLEFR